MAMRSFILLTLLLFFKVLLAGGFKDLPGLDADVFSELSNLSVGDISFKTGDTSAENIAKFVSAQEAVQAYKKQIKNYNCGDDSGCKAEKVYLEKLADYNSQLIEYYYAKATGSGSVEEPSFTASDPGCSSTDCRTLLTSVSSLDYDELDARALKRRLLSKFPACTGGYFAPKEQLSEACQRSINNYLAYMVSKGNVSPDVAKVNYSGPNMCTKTQGLLRDAGTGISAMGSLCNGILAKKYAKGKFNIGDTRSLKYCAVCTAVMPKVSTVCDNAVQLAYQETLRRNAGIMGQPIQAPGTFPTNYETSMAQYMPNTVGAPTTTLNSNPYDASNSFRYASDITTSTANGYRNTLGSANDYTAATSIMSNFFNLRGEGGDTNNNSIVFRGSGRGDEPEGSLTQVSNGNLDLVQALETQRTYLKGDLNPRIYNTCYVAGNQARTNYILNPGAGTSSEIFSNNMGCFRNNMEKARVVGDINAIEQALLCKRYKHNCDNIELELNGPAMVLNDFSSSSMLAEILRSFYTFASMSLKGMSNRRPRVFKLGPLKFKAKRYKVKGWRGILKARLVYLDYMLKEYNSTLNLYRAKVKRLLRKRMPIFKNIVKPSVVLSQLDYVRRLKKISKKNEKTIKRLISINSAKLHNLKVRGKNKGLKKLTKLNKGLLKFQRVLSKTHKLSAKNEKVYKKAFYNSYEFIKNYYGYWMLRKSLLRKN